MASPSFSNLPVPPGDSHNWTSAYQKFQANNDAAGYLAWLQQNKPSQLAAFQAANSGTGTGAGAGAGDIPTTGPGSSGIPGIGAYPKPTGVTITQPAADPYGAAARFGGVPGGGLDPLNYRIYTGNMSTAALPPGSTNPGSGTPAPVLAPVPQPNPAPSTIPAAPGGGVPTPGSGAGGQQPGNQGNAGGAHGADRGGLGGLFGGDNNRGMAFGDQGGGGANTRVTAQPTGPNSVDIAAEQGLTPGSLGYIDIGAIGTGLLGAASTLTPFPYSLIPTLAGGAMRAINTGTTDSIRAKQGLPGLDFGQWAGSVLGLNNYGSTSGDATIANPDQYGDLQKSLDAKQLGSDPMAGFFKANTLGLPTGETVMGEPYSSGPGGILGYLMGGEKQPAASVQTTNDQLSGDEAAKRLVETSGLSLAEARAVLAAMKAGQPGSSALTGGNSWGTGVAGAPLTGQSAAQVNRYGGATAAAPAAAPAMTVATAPKVKAANDPYAGWSAQDFAQAMSVRNPPPDLVAAAARFGIGAGLQSNGAAADNRQSALNPGGTFSNPGGGMTAPGTAGTGGLNNGFGGGGYEAGGFVRGRPDNIPDNRRINADEREYVFSKDPAAILGPTVLNWLNNAPNAARAKGLLEGVIGKADPKGPGVSGDPRSAISAAAAGDLRGLVNREPLMMGRTVGREPRGGGDASTPASRADLLALMAADQPADGRAPALPGPMDPAAMGGPRVDPAFPIPPRKPGAPILLAGRVIPGKGIGAGRQIATNSDKRLNSASFAIPTNSDKSRQGSQSESDRLNKQMVAMILARRAAQQASAGQGMRFGA